MEKLSLKIVSVSFNAHWGQSFQVRCTDVPETATSIEAELFKGRNRTYSNTLPHNGGDLKHLLPPLFGDHKLYVAAKSGDQTVAEGQYDLDGPWRPTAIRNMKVAIVAVVVSLCFPLGLLAHWAARVIAVFTSNEMEILTLGKGVYVAATIVFFASIVGLGITVFIALADKVGDLKEWISNWARKISGHGGHGTPVAGMAAETAAHLGGDAIKGALHRLPWIGGIFRFIFP